MGEPTGLSMRGGAPQPASSSNPPVSTPPPTVEEGSPGGLPTPARRIRLSLLDLSDHFVPDASGTTSSPSVVIHPRRSIWAEVDNLDRTTWALQGVGTLAGVGLLVGRDDKLSHWAGTFMITTSASELLWEWIDRRHHLAHDHRHARFAVSAMTGMIVSNLVVLGFGDFRAGSLGDPGRNSTNGYGP